MWCASLLSTLNFFIHALILDVCLYLVYFNMCVIFFPFLYVIHSSSSFLCTLYECIFINVRKGVSTHRNCLLTYSFILFFHLFYIVLLLLLQLYESCIHSYLEYMFKLKKNRSYTTLKCLSLCASVYVKVQ